MADDQRPVPEKDEKGRFIAGNSGNGGRPRGARSKLGEAFIDALYENWLQNGVATIEAVRTTKPDQYLKVIASLLPQQLNVKVSEWDELSDEQLDQRISAIARALELEIGVGKAARREAAASAGKPLN